MAVGNVFNEQWYLKNHPDVAEAVQQGLISALEHFDLYGKHEGRAPSPLFDPEHYLAQNPDVAAAMAAGLTTAYDHFVQYGAHESREPVAYFDADFYLQQNPDIAAAVEQGLTTAVEHFLQFGQSEPRPVSPFFDLGAYIAANPDIAEAVEAGLISPLDHLLSFGFTEGRDLGNGVTLAQFQNDPVFQNALVQGGNVFDALTRVAVVAPFLPTFQPPVGWVAPSNTPVPVDFVPPPGTVLVIPPTVVVPPDTQLPDTFEPPQPPAPAPAPVPPPDPDPDPGGGPGDSPPRTFFALEGAEGGVPVISFTGSAVGNIVMSVDATGLATFMRQGVTATNTVQLDTADLLQVRLAGTQRLIVEGEDLHDLNVNFTGSGSVDITGVTLTPSAVAGGVAQFADVSSDLYKVLLPAANARINAPDTVPVITVNGRAADFIKANWIYFDKQYYENWPDDWITNYYDLELSKGKADLALLYIQYLEGGGDAVPFLNFVAKTAVQGGVQSRSQWVHDNILGEITEAALTDRFGAVDRADELAYYLTEAGDFTDRPWISGNFNVRYNNDHKAALAFDYERGWVRDDYIHSQLSGTLDNVAIDDGVEMYMGDGNKVTGFALARHEGAGIELALKARKDHGGDCDLPEREPGRVLYKAERGESPQRMCWGVSARWFVDFSVSTRLKGVEKLLDDFRFVLSVDTSPVAEPPCLCRFLLTRPGSLYHPSLGEIDIGRAWLLVGEGDGILLKDGALLPEGFGDDLEESVNSFVSQNAVNFGLNFMRRLLGDYARSDNPQSFGPGVFDIRLEAFDDDGALLLDNHIQVQVE